MVELSGNEMRTIDLKIDSLDRVSIPTKIVATFDVTTFGSNTRFLGPLMAYKQGVHSNLYVCIEQFALS